MARQVAATLPCCQTALLAPSAQMLPCREVRQKLTATTNGKFRLKSLTKKCRRPRQQVAKPAPPGPGKTHSPPRSGVPDARPTACLRIQLRNFLKAIVKIASYNRHVSAPPWTWIGLSCSFRQSRLGVGLRLKELRGLSFRRQRGILQVLYLQNEIPHSAQNDSFRNRFSGTRKLVSWAV